MQLSVILNVKDLVDGVVVSAAAVVRLVLEDVEDLVLPFRLNASTNERLRRQEKVVVRL